MQSQFHTQKQMPQGFLGSAPRRCRDFPGPLELMARTFQNLHKSCLRAGRFFLCETEA